MLPSRRCLVGLVAVLTAGCGGGVRTLDLAPVTPAYVDRSSVSPSLAQGSFDRIMIVPPSGSAGVAFQDNLAAIERSFIARGITVVSSAITGRVLLDDQTGDGQGSEAGLRLSEVERALLMARKTNADAVLQIGRWRRLEASESRFGTRYFLEDPDTRRLVEVDRAQYEEAVEEELLRRVYASDVLAFTGRLIDVDSGEVVASFLIDVPEANVADPLYVTVKPDGEIASRSYSWDGDEDRRRARTERAVATLFDRLAALISNADP